MSNDRLNRMARREVLRSAGALAGTMALGGRPASAAHNTSPERVSRDCPTACLFTKPLQNRPFDALPPLLNEMGINAIDLTVRPGGHVLPERVEEDLPKAHEQLADAGIAIPMVTTAITDAEQGHAEAIVRSAAGLGIRYAKLGYYRYGDLRRIRATLADVKARLKDVAAVFRKYGVQAGFHNHSGHTVGAAMWDVAEVINGLPPEAIGSYFDIRHATVEGGLAGWKIGLHLLAPRMVMAAVKDFAWQNREEKGWRVENVPLGKGMIQLEPALRMMKASGFAGPISLHMEYGQRKPAVGSEADKSNLAAIQADWVRLLDTLQQVG